MRIALILSLLVVVMASGCGYTLQGRADLPFSEVTIGEIKNNTPEPKLQDKMHRLLAETFMEYGVDVHKYARYRIEGTFDKFDVHPVAEKDLKAVQYRVEITGHFKIIDTQTIKAVSTKGIRTKAKTMSVAGDQKTKFREEDLGAMTNPYLTYFRSSGLLVNVIASKDVATEKALKDMSQEIILRIIYKLPKAGAEAKKGESKIEPETVPAGNR